MCSFPYQIQCLNSSYNNSKARLIRWLLSVNNYLYLLNSYTKRVIELKKSKKTIDFNSVLNTKDRVPIMLCLLLHPKSKNAYKTFSTTLEYWIRIRISYLKSISLVYVQLHSFRLKSCQTSRQMQKKSNKANNIISKANRRI